MRKQPLDLNNIILALDFDGVIVNSISECLVSGHNAYCEYAGGHKVERVDQLDKKWIKKAKFIRNFIRYGEDYVYIAYALDQKVSIKNQHDFDLFRQKHTKLRDQFFDVMYNERLWFAEQKSQEWIKLNPLYNGMRDFLTDYPNPKNLYIITTKKLIFVHKILDAHTIKLHTPNLYDTSNYSSKKEIIEHILNQRNFNPKNFYFIDDQVDTLIKVKPGGVHCILAEWGYNNETQAQKAEEENIPVLGLADFYTNFS